MKKGDLVYYRLYSQKTGLITVEMGEVIEPEYSEGVALILKLADNEQVFEEPRSSLEARPDQFQTLPHNADMQVARVQ